LLKAKAKDSKFVLEDSPRPRPRTTTLGTSIPSFMYDTNVDLYWTLISWKQVTSVPSEVQKQSLSVGDQGAKFPLS